MSINKSQETKKTTFASLSSISLLLIIIITVANSSCGSAQENLEKHGQDVQVSFSTHERDTGSKLQNTKILIMKGNDKITEGVTDNSGSLILTVPSGKYKFSAVKGGYNTVEAEIDTTKMNAAPVDIALTPIIAFIDRQLLDAIDETAPKYYNSDWKISLSQYKAWIATIAWSEGGSGGYSAHSQYELTDKLPHYAMNAFAFSSGIGPFQIDTLKEKWPTIDKLNYKKTLELVLETSSSRNNKALSKTLIDFQKTDSQIWYGVKPIMWKDGKKYKGVEDCWLEVTGTKWDWTDPANLNKESKDFLDLDWSGIREKLDSGARNQKFDTSYEGNIQDKGQKKWVFKYEVGATKIEFNGDYPTWYISARSSTGALKFNYYYTYRKEDNIEVWAWDHQDNKDNYRYVFIRDCSKGRFPYKQDLEVADKTEKAGIELQQSAVILSQSNNAPSSIVGEWTLHSRLDNTFISSDTTIIFNGDHTLRDLLDPNVKGKWTQDGNTVHWEYDDGCRETVYDGTMGIGMKGIMQNNEGDRGDWSADRRYTQNLV